MGEKFQNFYVDLDHFEKDEKCLIRYSTGLLLNLIDLFGLGGNPNF